MDTNEQTKRNKDMKPEWNISESVLNQPIETENGSVVYNLILDSLLPRVKMSLAFLLQ